MGRLLLLSLLLLGPLLGLVSQPYQWLSELGFRLQALWPLGREQPLQPLLLLAPLLGSWALVWLGSGPLQRGVGGGVTPVLALQEAGSEDSTAASLGRLSLGTQLIRLPLLALTHLGGLIHDTMSLGALLASPWLEGLGGVDRSTLVLSGAVALFSGACRTPLFCSLFVVRISGDASLLPVLLLLAAVAAVIGSWLAPATWNEVQLSRFQTANARTVPDPAPAADSARPG